MKTSKEFERYWSDIEGPDARVFKETAWNIWQAATRVEREGCAQLMESTMFDPIVRDALTQAIRARGREET